MKSVDKWKLNLGFAVVVLMFVFAPATALANKWTERLHKAQETIHKATQTGEQGLHKANQELHSVKDMVERNSGTSLTEVTKNKDGSSTATTTIFHPGNAQQWQGLIDQANKASAAKQFEDAKLRLGIACDVAKCFGNNDPRLSQSYSLLSKCYTQQLAELRLNPLLMLPRVVLLAGVVLGALGFLPIGLSLWSSFDGSASDAWLEHVPKEAWCVIVIAVLIGAPCLYAFSLPDPAELQKQADIFKVKAAQAYIPPGT